MLSKITKLCGLTFTALKSLAAKIDEFAGRSCWGTFSLVTLCVYLHASGFKEALAWKPLDMPGWALLGHMFSHANWSHLIGNMTMLVLTGPFVERVMGFTKYLLAYVICGLVAALGYLSLIGGASVLGASGAVSGVMIMAAFCQRTWMMSFLFGGAMFVHFGEEFYEALIEFIAPIFSRTAHIAHIIGAITGLVCIGFFYRFFSKK